jgi:hypothetical protein
VKQFSSLLLLVGIVLAALCPSALSQNEPARDSSSSFLGFDRNEYPGDANLAALHQTFAFSGYWLNDPPGEQSNTWARKRAKLESAGFGFLVLFNGRLYKDLLHNAAALGQADGKTAAGSAKREGFPARTIIFLDIEQGGRMLTEQKAYIYAWVDAVTANGFRAGVYCSGIPAQEGKISIVTADDIRQNSDGRAITFFVTKDVCPPSPGCGFGKTPAAGESGIIFAEVWQFAQSPKRPDFAAECPANYNADGNCYPPGVDPALKLHVDVETAVSADPSAGR